MFYIPGTIYGLTRAGNPASVNVPRPVPSWVPSADSVSASLYADFTTEGSANDYWYNNATFASFTAFLSALSGTFSRASTAYYTNSSGLLTSASSNIARFDYDPISLVAKGLLLEGARTNSFLQSNTFSNSVWTNTSSTVTQNVTGPDGVANSAWTLAATSTLSYFFQSLSIANPSAISIYAKAGTATFLIMQVNSSGGTPKIWFDLSAGVVRTTESGWSSATIKNVGNGWYRCSAKISITSGSLVAFFLADADGSLNVTSGHTISVYGAQDEGGNSFASSYIPTTTTTATRAAESLTWGWPALSSGTVFVEGDTPDVSAARYLSQLDDGTANNRISLTFNSSAAGAFDVVSGGVSQAALSNGTVTAGVAKKLAGAFAANDFALVVAAGTPQTDTSGSVPSVTTFRLGVDSGGANHPYGHIKQVAIWNNLRASNTAMQTLTA